MNPARTREEWRTPLALRALGWLIMAAFGIMAIGSVVVGIMQHDAPGGLAGGAIFSLSSAICALMLRPYVAVDEGVVVVQNYFTRVEVSLADVDLCEASSDGITIWLGRPGDKGRRSIVARAIDKPVLYDLLDIHSRADTVASTLMERAELWRASHALYGNVDKPLFGRGRAASAISERSDVR